MGKRFFFGFTMLFALAGMLALDHYLHFTWGFFLITLAGTLGGIHELKRMFRMKGLPLDDRLLMLVNVLTLLYIQLVAAPPDFGAIPLITVGAEYPNWLGVTDNLRELTLLIPAAAVLGFSLVGLQRKDVPNLSARIVNNLGIYLYLTFPIALILWMRHIPGSGEWLLFFLLAASRMGDVGAYIMGSLLGRHKLIPHLSKGKTIEGAFFGLLFSSAAGLGIIMWANWADNGVFERLMPEWWYAAILGLFVGVAAQAGDLVESGFKRMAGIKDSGDLVPSFGGVMDIIDNFMLTGPLVLCILALWPV